MFDKSIKPPPTSINSLSPTLNYIRNKRKVKFDRSYLEEDKLTYTHVVRVVSTVVSTYIVYEINLRPFKRSSNSPLRTSLFGAVKLTMNDDFDK